MGRAQEERRTKKEKVRNKMIRNSGGEPQMRERKTRPCFFSEHDLHSHYTPKSARGQQDPKEVNYLPFLLFPWKHNSSFRKQREARGDTVLFILTALRSADMVF